MDIFVKVKELGIPYANHESDLYIPVTEQTRQLMHDYEFASNVTVFQNQVTNTAWYDVPFAYLPYWEAKQAVTR
jgi:hypothetical protein